MGGEMKKRSKKIKEFFKRNKVNKGAGWVSLVLVVVSLVGLILCSSYLNETTVSASQGQETIDMEKYHSIAVLKDIAIVVFSTFGVNLLISFCIEKNGKNKAFEEFFAEEIISAPDFYKSLNFEDKQKMITALELENYYNGSLIKKEICDHTREKIIENTKNYFFADCFYNVTVEDKTDFFEKTVIYSFSVKPYDRNTTIKDVALAQVTNKKIAGLDIVKINSIQYNGNDITKKCKAVNLNLNERFGEKKDFDNVTKIVYDERIKLSKDGVAKFIVNLTTRCPKDDITSSFKATAPCERFGVSYRINSNKYKVKAYAFGVCKQAENSSAKETPNEANIKFSDWIFTDDGVVVVMCQV